MKREQTGMKLKRVMILKMRNIEKSTVTDLSPDLNRQTQTNDET